MKDAYNKVFRKWLQLICGTQERELMVEFSKPDADYPGPVNSIYPMKSVKYNYHLKCKHLLRSFLGITTYFLQR
jgi:hypothetical protein